MTRCEGTKAEPGGTFTGPLHPRPHQHLHPRLRQQWSFPDCHGWWNSPDCLVRQNSPDSLGRRNSPDCLGQCQRNSADQNSPTQKR